MRGEDDDMPNTHPHTGGVPFSLPRRAAVTTKNSVLSPHLEEQYGPRDPLLPLALLRLRVGGVGSILRAPVFADEVYCWSLFHYLCLWIFLGKIGIYASRLLIGQKASRTSVAAAVFFSFRLHALKAQRKVA